MTGSRYATSVAFRAAVTSRLKAAAAARGRPLGEVRREFVFQRLLARLFHDPASPWILKGGVGLLVRLPDARYSRDIDVVRNGIDVLEAAAELRELAGRDLDHLRYVVGRSRKNLVGVDGVTLPIDTYCGGAAVWERFSVDLSVDLSTLGPAERLRPEPVIELPGLSSPPLVTLYPLVDQVADKVCAMLGTYAGRPSTRYRDLVDLVLIVGRCRLPGPPAGAALRAEADRRGLVLPPELTSPGADWSAGYSALARSVGLVTPVDRLEGALAAVNDCLRPVLGGPIQHGEWDPACRSWIVPATPSW